MMANRNKHSLIKKKFSFKLNLKRITTNNIEKNGTWKTDLFSKEKKIKNEK